MKFTHKEAKEILASFNKLTEETYIDNITKSHPDEFSTFYQFEHGKQTWGVLINDALDDNDEAEIRALAPWQDNEVEIIANPNVDGFGLPFRQKTCFLLARNLHDLRLDVFLAQQYPEFSRAKLQKMIKNSQVKVNEKIETSPKKSINPQVDKIELINHQPDAKNNISFEILFENDDLLIINKPAGVLSHATHQDKDDEFTVADFIKQRGEFDSENYRDGIVHRLDRATSGVMILAKNQPTANYFKQQFKDRKIHKTYHAVVTGQLKHPQAKIDLPLKRSLKNAGKFMVDASGKEAITIYHLVKSIDDQHLIKLQPQTGRTHQLRVHMNYLNLPILGDYLYDGRKFSRLMLHASEISFTDQNGQKITVAADLPPEFEAWTK